LVAQQVVFIEGGGDTREQQVRCREAFRALFDKCGFGGRRPRLVACGGHNTAFDSFKTELRSGSAAFVALLVDSEDPVANIDRPWDHLRARDKWVRPDGATDDQVLLMTTSMETWVVADRNAIARHLGNTGNLAKLPSSDLENRQRQDILRALEDATRNSRTEYVKGSVSFQYLGRVDPVVLRAQLPSFDRAIRILEDGLEADR
jgi:hypothetical protein